LLIDEQTDKQTNNDDYISSLVDVINKVLKLKCRTEAIELI